MMVTVLLFARARELAGADRILLAVPEEAVVADVRRELARMYPTMAGLVDHSALALHDDLVDDACLIFPHAELALLPPVSGGTDTILE
jgi:molybdopterin converting factor small subunit